MDILEFVSRHIIGSVHVLLQQAIVLQVVKEKHDIKRLVISTVLLRAASVLIEQYVHYLSAFKMIVWVVLLFLSYLLIFKQPVIKSILLSLGQMLLTTFLEYAIMPLYLALKEIDVYGTTSQFYLRLFTTMLLLTLYLISRKMKFTALMEYKKEKLRLWVIYFVFLFLFAFPNITYMELSETIPIGTMEMYNMILFIFFFAYNIICVHNIFKITSISQQLETQELYLQTMEQNSLHLRAFKHDYINIVNSLGGMIEAGDIQGTRRFCRELGVELLNVNNVSFISDQLEDFPQLRGIMLSKANVAALNNIEFRLSIPCDIKLNYCTSVDFCRIVGILLDNALEAAKQAKRKYIEFAVIHRREVYRIIIRNTCPEPVNTEHIFDQGYTTKESHEGLGMYTVKRIVDKYRNDDYAMEIRTQYRNEEFIATLTV